MRKVVFGPLDYSVRLRRFRDSYRMSQTQMAKVAGVSRNLYISWETHKGRFTPAREEHQKTVKLMCDHFGVTPESFWDPTSRSVIPSTKIEFDAAKVKAVFLWAIKAGGLPEDLETYAQTKLVSS